MKSAIQLILLLLLPLGSIAQLTDLEVRKIANNASEREIVIECSRLMQDNYLYQAEILADKLLTLQPTSANYNYRKGYILLAAKHDYAVAKRHLQLAIVDTDKNYDMYSHTEKSAAIDAHYHLARCYHLDEEIDKARQEYQTFIEKSNKGSELVEKAEVAIKQCDVANALYKEPKNVLIKNLGRQINTNLAEYSPVISLDGNSLYFTSRRQWEDFSSDEFKDPMDNSYPEDIFVSYLDFEGEWTSPERLFFCDNMYNEATIAVSSDEREIYVYKDNTGSGDIYYSSFIGNKFDSLVSLSYNDVNTQFWETHCTMTPDGENMYFVSDRPGGYGGRDIYRIVRLPNGEWSKAQNMGPEINTPNDEEAPYIDINNKTLYFASDGVKSMGGFDIFVTFRDEENNWSPPINMGYPFNSTGDDLFYTTTIDGLKGYLTSFRKDGMGEKDIYEVENDYMGNRPVSAFKGAFVSMNNDPVPDGMVIKLLCPTCDNEKNRISEPRIKEENRFFSVLERCKEYTAEYYYPDGQLISRETFTTACDTENEEIDKTIYIGSFALILSASDFETLKPIPQAKIELVNRDNNSVMAIYSADEAGKVNSDYLKGKSKGDEIHINIRVSQDGYLTQTFKLDTVIGNEGVLSFDYPIHPVSVGTDLTKTLDLNPIYFDLNKSNIRPDAAAVLDRIVVIMNENPEMKIELGSHTDCRGSKTYNEQLSSKRAKSSAKYIQERITKPERIYGKGYGESVLVNHCACEGNVVSDCSDEEHQANRRTEFKIVE